MKIRSAPQPRPTPRKAVRSPELSQKIATVDRVSFAPKKVLAPVDFSQSSDRALQYSIDFARRANAQILLLHVIEAFPIDYIMGIESAKKTNDWQLKQIRAQLHELAGKLGGDFTASMESIVKFGKPFQEIADVARDEAVDLIIIATHGYTGLKHIQLGSTAEMVVRYAPCPVLVLPSRERAEGAG